MSSDDGSCDGKNTEGSISEDQVHSANSWETADLGDKQRNEKFLRLMGASKKEHHGKIVIGDTKPADKRQRKEEKHLAEQLEEQYEHSMEHRLVGGRRGHLGLGYHPDTGDKQELDKPELVEEVGVEAKEEESDEDSVPEQDDSDNSRDTTEDKESFSRTDRDSRGQKEGQRKRQSLDKSPESEKKKMKFVKSGK